MGQIPAELTFRYICPEDLRDLYVNGVYGGVTPRNEICIHFYSERHPIPKRVTHSIDSEGMIGKNNNIEIGGDVVRLVQASVSMNIGTAVALRDWLNERIDFIDKQKGDNGHES